MVKFGNLASGIVQTLVFTAFITGTGDLTYINLHREKTKNVVEVSEPIYYDSAERKGIPKRTPTKMQNDMFNNFLRMHMDRGDEIITREEYIEAMTMLRWVPGPWKTRTMQAIAWALGGQQ